MTLFLHRSVKQKVVLLVFLASALAILCVAIAVVFYELTTFQPRALARLKSEAGVLEEVLSAPLDFGLKEAARSGLYKHCADNPIVLAAIYTTNALFVEYRGENSTVSPPLKPGVPGHVFSARQLSLWHPLHNNENAIIGHLYLVLDLPPLHLRLPQYAIMTVVVLIALAVVGFIFIKGLRRNILDPLSMLLQTTTQVAQHNDYSLRADVQSKDELGQLAQAFNQMLEAVGQRDTALREANSRIENVFKSATEVLIVATDPQGLITVFSTGAERMLGYKAEEVVGKCTPLLWHEPEEIKSRGAELSGQLGRIIEGFEVFAAMARHGQSESREWIFVRKDGTYIDGYLVVTSVQDGKGNITGFVGVANDITERKRAEDEKAKLQMQLLQAQKMESVGRLAGGVAHDFNNMLQAILGNASMALEDLPTDSPIRESLEEIQKSAERSADLTRQLLAFARKQTIAPKVLDLNDTVSGMLKMLRRLIGENIDLAWLPGANIWPVKLDPSQVDQVLANLCVNARDAITGAGKVTIETSNIILDDTNATMIPDATPGDYVVLAVSDTGHGMDDFARSHLFEPFFTTKAIGKGTGLGLATVFGIVKQNHGLINVHSELNQGTTFKIYLPRIFPEISTVETSILPQLQRGFETILMVEDEEQVLNLGRRILEQQGYKVLAASAASKAISLADTHSGPIHLLITDVVMPELNGKELKHCLLNRHPKLKCLFMSGYTADIIADQGVLDEGVQFLQKPFTNHSLALKVREVLEQDCGQ